MIGVFHLEDVAIGKEIGTQALLPFVKVPLVFAGTAQGVIAALLLDGQIPLDGHVHHGRGEGLVIIPHVHDVAHRRRGKPLGRGEQGDDGPPGRVPSHPEPGLQK